MNDKQNQSIIISNDGDNNLNKFTNRTFRDQLNNSVVENQSSNRNQQSNIDYQLNLSINKQNLTSTEIHNSSIKEQINSPLSAKKLLSNNSLIDHSKQLSNNSNLLADQSNQLSNNSNLLLADQSNQLSNNSNLLSVDESKQLLFNNSNLLSDQSNRLCNNFNLLIDQSNPLNNNNSNLLIGRSNQLNNDCNLLIGRSNQLNNNCNLLTENSRQLITKQLSKNQQNTLSTIKSNDNDDLNNSLDNELVDSNSFIFKNENQIILNDNYIFNLNWQVKDDLILMINRFTAILSGQLINKQTKDKIIKTNNNLINTLINLKLKINSNNTQQFKYSINQQYLNTNLILDLESDLRMQLISHLIKLQNLSINKDNTVQLADTLKNELIIENNKLINQLLNLNVNSVERECEYNYLENEEIDKIKNKLEQLKNDQQLTNRDDLEYYESKFKEEINGLTEKLKEIKLIKRELESRQMISFVFEINDAISFLNTINIDKNSKEFYCNNQPWYILIRIAETKINKQKIKYLEFYLVNCLNLKSNEKWSLNANIDLILFSNNYKDIIFNGKNIKFSSSKNIWGIKRFIMIDDLINLNNGFIFTGDKLKLGINLKCDKLIVKKDKFLKIF